MKLMKKNLLLVIFFTFSVLLYSQRKPFPQHVNYVGEHNVLPNSQANTDAAVTQFYYSWKMRYLKNGCESGTYYINFDSDDVYSDKYITVSEGMGYGMMIVAYMAGYDPRAQEYFDGLFRMTRKRSSRFSPDLMAWALVHGCVDDGDPSAASDGDIDIAYALLLADVQWGSAGEINYYAEAKKIIDAIWAKLINSDIKTIKLGDWAGPGNKNNATRPSDFLLDHLRVFKYVCSEYEWEQVVDKCYSILDELQKNYSPQTGLIPDFVIEANTNPKPAGEYFLEQNTDGHYSYNSCRVPWRIATDYLLFGDERGKTVVDKINTWLRTSVNGNASDIVSGYKLSGEKMRDVHDNAFMAPFAVGAMIDVNNEQWYHDIYKKVIGSSIGNYDYYGSSIKMLSLIVMSGNYWVPERNMLTSGETILRSKEKLFEIVQNDNILTIELGKKYFNKSTDFQLCDLKGNILVSENLNSSTKRISKDKFPKGLYIIKVVCSEMNVSESRKIVF